MFHLYTVSGRVLSGSPEQMRHVQTTPVARLRRVTRVGADFDEKPELPSHSPPPLASDVGRHGALAEYAATGHGAGPQRQPLTRVSDVMSQQVLTLALDATVLQAWRQLAEHGYAQAPVVDAKGQLVGLFLRAELMHTELLENAITDASNWRKLLMQTVAERMTTPVPAATPETELRRVANVLIDAGLPGLPVVDEQGGVTGFVSRTDIMRAVVADPPLDLWG
jgi:CBS domain-containing protein